MVTQKAFLLSLIFLVKFHFMAFIRNLYFQQESLFHLKVLLFSAVLLYSDFDQLWHNLCNLGTFRVINAKKAVKIFVIGIIARR